MASACIETGDKRNKGSLGGAGTLPATGLPRGTGRADDRGGGEVRSTDEGG